MRASARILSGDMLEEERLMAGLSSRTPYLQAEGRGDEGAPQASQIERPYGPPTPAAAARHKGCRRTHWMAYGLPRAEWSLLTGR